MAILLPKFSLSFCYTQQLEAGGVPGNKKKKIGIGNAGREQAQELRVHSHVGSGTEWTTGGEIDAILSAFLRVRDSFSLELGYLCHLI